MGSSQMTSMVSDEDYGFRTAWMTPPVDRIALMLESPDPEVRAAAFRFFAKTRGNEIAFDAAEKAVYDKDEDRNVRYAAAQALSSNAPDDEQLIAHANKIEKLLPRIEAAFLENLTRRDLPEDMIAVACRWLPTAYDPHGANLSSAELILKRFGDRANPELLRTLQDAEWDTAKWALARLLEKPQTHTEVAKAIRLRLQDFEKQFLLHGTETLFRGIAQTFPPEDALETLTRFASQPDLEKLRLQGAVESIGLIRPVRKEAVEFIRNILRRPEDGFRYQAIRASGKMGLDGSVLVSELLDIIENETKLRDTAMHQVYEISSVASVADFQRLLRLAENKDVNEYQTETAILGRVLSQEPKYFERVRKAWSERPKMLLQLSVVRIDNSGNVIKLPADLQEKVLPLLIEQYVKKGPGLVQPALASIGIRDQRVIDEARRRVAEEEPSIAGQALALMAQLHPVEKSETRLILNSLNSEDMWIRSGAATACEYLGPMAIDALPQLIQIAQSPNSSGRYNAIRAIGEIAPPSEEILDVLRKATAEQRRDIQAASEKALARIAERAAKSN